MHNCEKCKGTVPGVVLPYPPVYSFGNPEGKHIIAVGQNPSSKEYENLFLSRSPNVQERRESQLTYFERRKYSFFDELERFLGGGDEQERVLGTKVRERIGWQNSPWEKVGYLDLVKRPTQPINGEGQWSKIPKKAQQTIIGNCESYLSEQLNLYQPKIILAYGADVGRWFSSYFDVLYEEFEERTAQLRGNKANLMFIPQRQGPHSKPEVLWVQAKILKMLEENPSPTR